MNNNEPQMNHVKMNNDNNNILLWEFSEKMVDFVLEDRGFESSQTKLYTESASNSFDPSIGKIVIGLIKGELRSDFIKTTPKIFIKTKTLDEMEQVLETFPEIFFRIYPFNNFNVLKAISYIIMHSIFYYFHDSRVEKAFYLACRGIVRLLQTANDGQFLQENGFTNLINYSTNLIKTQPNLETAYACGTYPW